MTSPAGASKGIGRVGWRLDRLRHADEWDSGEGAFQVGGRWNSAGVRAVYASVNAATAILEVAVHKGFDALDVDPHVLTRFVIDDDAAIHVVEAGQVPNPAWLLPAIPSAGQQRFGDGLLAEHPFVVLPSVMSPHDRNVVFDPDRAKGLYAVQTQDRFALDTRLNRPAP